MPRYVDVDNIGSFMVCAFPDDEYAIGWNEAIAKIETSAPTADVAPIIHAKWEKIKRTAYYTDGIGVDLETGKPCIRKKGYEYDEYKCPVCKKFAKGDYLRFCDYCGAKFDEMFEKDEDGNKGENICRP